MRTQVTIWTGGASRTFPAETGSSLSALLRENGYVFDMPCGGGGRCKKCRVRAIGALSPLTGEEKETFSEQELCQGFRLACRASLQGEAAVYLESAPDGGQICREGAWTAVDGVPLFSRLGAAVDIGTTTLAAQLFDRKGRLGSAGAVNPQRSYGADVLSRVERAMAGEAPALARCVRQEIGRMLEEMCRRAGRSCREIDGLVLTGNTAMLHLLTREDPSPLAAAPFRVRERFGKRVNAATVGLDCAPDAQVYLPRCMSSFVGADITTALLASVVCEGEDTALLVDVGTNGEMALWHRGKLTCCSTAAGPAFEGAGLSQGMQGTAGAIDHAWIENGALRFSTVAGAPALGVCGSGVVDLLACLLELGAMDETGRLENEDGYVALTDRVRLTQGDIRQVQLAKSAIRAGLEALLHEAGLSPEDISVLAVAGGFGSYLSLDSAARIGLFPAELVNRSRVLGNAALSGAAMLLHSAALEQGSAALADSAETLDLASNPFFMERYIDHMYF